MEGGCTTNDRGALYRAPFLCEGFGMKNGLILEGGGTRGMFSAAVLDCFMEEGIEFQYVIGSSSGVCNAMNYIANQPGRSKKIMLLSKKENYAGLRELFLHGSFMNLKKLYCEMPYQEKTRFDFDTYFASPVENEFVVSNCLTGKAEYLNSGKDEQELAAISIASCSLPLLSRPVKKNDTWYMDGSMTDPIPVQHTLDKGCDKIVLISTKGEGMEPSDLGKYNWAMRILYGKKFNPYLEAIKNRLDLYNAQWEMIYELQKQGKLFLIQPQGDIAISHLETNPELLRKMYDSGYAYAQAIRDDIRKFLSE